MAAHGLMGCEDAPYVARRFLLEDKSPTRGVDHLASVLSQEPDCTKAHFELGIVFKNMGNLTKAHQHLEKSYLLVRDVLGSADGSDIALAGRKSIDFYAMPVELQRMFPAYKTSRPKMQHDAQQLAMLLKDGKLGRGAYVCLTLPGRCPTPTCFLSIPSLL